MGTIFFSFIGDILGASITPMLDAANASSNVRFDAFILSYIGVLILLVFALAAILGYAVRIFRAIAFKPQGRLS
jgi:hypothetical protein